MSDSSWGALTDEQIDRIAEKAADKAVAKLTDQVYREVGKGVVQKLGYASVKTLHDKLVVGQPDGEIFHTITYGKATMYPYGSQISIEDRWAIVAYVRALQRSRLGSLDEVPAELKAGLK